MTINNKVTFKTTPTYILPAPLKNSPTRLSLLQRFGDFISHIFCNSKPRKEQPKRNFSVLNTTTPSNIDSNWKLQLRKISHSFFKTVLRREDFDEIKFSNSKNSPKIFLGVDPVIWRNIDSAISKKTGTTFLKFNFPALGIAKSQEPDYILNELKKLTPKIQSAFNQLDSLSTPKPTNACKTTNLYISGDSSETVDLSSAALAAYLIQYQKFSVEDAIKTILESRPTSNINHYRASLNLLAEENESNPPAMH